VDRDLGARIWAIGGASIGHDEVPATDDAWVDGVSGWLQLTPASAFASGTCANGSSGSALVAPPPLMCRVLSEA